MILKNANDVIEARLRELNSALATYLQADVLALRSPIRFGVDDAIRSEVESLNMKKTDPTGKLAVLLETTGGFIEVVERIYSVFRHHYRVVDFIIPNYAYSAGTVLALSGDEVYMDYYSVLGPIDPQYENEHKELVPGMGYLAKYKELIRQINGAGGSPIDAELAYLIKKFDPAKLYSIEQACKHAESLLKMWLPRHKFKNWTVTESSKKPVTDKMKEDRAGMIAEVLGNPERWNSHGRGIGIKELDSEEIKLKVVNLDKEPVLNGHVRVYYELLTDFCAKLKAESAIHTSKGLRRV